MDQDIKSKAHQEANILMDHFAPFTGGNVLLTVEAAIKCAEMIIAAINAIEKTDLYKHIIEILHHKKTELQK